MNATATRLTSSLHHKQHLRFTPDGRHLVYARTIGPRITLMSAPRAGGEERVLFPERRDDFIQQHPAWSPDARRLAFTINDGLRSLRIGIFQCDADGLTFTNFRPFLMGGQDSFPTWSPDGRQVAFISGSQRLYVANADATGRRLLGPSEGLSGQPSWAPRGDRIAFSSSHEGSMEIFTIRPDGRDLIRLTTNDRVDYRPVFSPDGQWLAFTSGRDGNYDIYVMRPDGSAIRNFSNHSALNDHAAWSPDGRELAFISTRDGGYDVYRVSV